MATSSSILSNIASYLVPTSWTGSSSIDPSEIDSKTPLKSKNLLEKTHALGYQTLAQLDAKQRSGQRRLLGLEILKKGKDWRGYADWRQFALMQCPGIIRQTSLEGGCEIKSAFATIRFLNACLGGEGLFFDVGDVPKSVFTKLLDSLFQLRSLISYRPELTEKSTPKVLLEQHVEGLFSQIQSYRTLSTRGVYLPLGYRHGTLNQGHSIVCKIKEEADNIILSLFNLGNGSDSHPVLNYTLDQKKTSYSFFPISIPKKHFFGKLGKAAFCHLFRYLADAPKSYQAGYDGHDIYDILLQFCCLGGPGKVLDLRKKSDMEAETQISGNCPEEAIRCSTEDLLIDEDIPKIQREKILLNRDFFSLILHYHAFVHNPSCHPSARELLHDAAKSFDAKISDLQKMGQLSANEIIGSTAVVHEILRAAEKTPYPPGPSAHQPEASTPSDHRLFEALPSLKKASASAEDLSKVPSLTQYKLKPPTLSSMDKLPEALKSWTATAASLPQEEAFQYVTDCIRELPIPASRDDEVWKEFPSNLTLEALCDLEKLLKQGLRGVKVAKFVKEEVFSKKPSESFVEQFLLIYSCYAIADRLARGQDKSKLEGFASPFLPLGFTFTPHEFTALPLAEDNRRFTAISQYFTGKKLLTDEGYKEKTIFPIQPILNVQQFVSDLLHGTNSKDTIQGKNHVEYLARFMPNSASSSETSLASHYCKNWLSILPQPVQSLYYFSFLSHALFSAQGAPFPSTLKLEPTSYLGKSALMIQNPFFSERKEEQKTNLALFGQDHKPKLDKPIYDKRFDCLQPPVDDFIDIHAPEIAALKTNDAVCYTLAEKDAKEWSIDESAIRKLLYDTRKANLSLWQVLQDFTAIENHYLLEHPGVQNILDASLFHPHFLLERLKQEPKPLISAFRKFIAEGLRRYNDNPAQLKAILFLLREGICFESYLPHHREKEETLRFYKTTLDNLSSIGHFNQDWSDIFSHRLLLEMQSMETNESTLIDVFERNVDYCLAHKGSTWVYAHLPRLTRQLAYRFYPTLIDPAKRNNLCNRIIQGNGFIQGIIDDQEVLQTLKGVNWEGDFPQYACGDLVIDFFTGTISSKKHNGVLQRKHFSKDQNTHGVSLTKYGNLFWVSENEKKGERLISLNGKLKYCPTRSKWFELVASLDGSVKECEITGFDSEEIKKYGQDFLSEQNDLPFIHYKHQGCVISHGRKTNKPYLIMETQGSNVTYTRLDEASKKLPYTLANVANLNPSDPLYPYTTRYAHPSEILCFVDESRGKKIHEINFYKLGLEFVSGTRGLVWWQDKDFVLIGGPSDLTTTEEKNEYQLLLQEINGFEGAMILYDSTRKKWNVLFPHSNFSKVVQTGEDFSRNVGLNKSKQITEYFQFEFDCKEKTLKTLKMDHDRSNAYLALLYKLQRDYPKSTRYLDKIKSTSFFKEDTLEMLGYFTDIIDPTPASLAFNLKLSLKVIKNKDLLLEKQFAHKPSSLVHKNFYRFAMENYKLYFSKNNASRVSHELQLSPLEKKMLVLAFRRSYEEQNYIDKEGKTWQERWKKEQPILDGQYHAYFSPDSKNTLTPAPQEISLLPPIYSSLKRPDEFTVSPSDFISKAITKYQSKNNTLEEKEEFEIDAYPIRVTEKAIAINFKKLFNEAVSCPVTLCEFDFKLQALLKARPEEPSTYIGHLFFWVRHFPEQFWDCSFEKAALWKEYKVEFDKIFERVKELPKRSPEKFAWFEKQLKAKHLFQIGKPIPLISEKQNHKNRKVTLPASFPIPTNLASHATLIEKQLYRLFNSPYKVKNGVLTPEEAEDEIKFLIGKDSAQLLSFPKKDRLKADSKGEALPEAIMKHALLKNNLNYLDKHRPMLKEPEMNELCRLTCEWYHTRMLLKLKQEGKENLYIPYDTYEHPEIAYYYLKSNKFPTNVQMETYKWGMQQLKAGKKCHFQLPTGAGKSDVLGPLFHLGAKRLGLMPASCVTQSIYPIEKENLSYNLKVLGQDLCFLEIGMHMINQLSSLDLEFILSELWQYKADGKSLIYTRHTYDALFLIEELALKSAVEEKNAPYEARLERGRKIRFAHDILEFLGKQILLICDESHQNLDPLTKAIVGTGDLVTLSDEESSHLAYLTSFALKCEAPKNPTELKALKAPLAQDAIDKICPILSPLDRQALIDFCTDENAKQPEILKLLGESSKPDDQLQANLICLTSRFLLHLLSDIHGLKTNVDHARSLYPQRKYEVPAHNEMPSTAEYDDRFKTCTLTYKGNHQRGLSAEDIRLILTDMMKESLEEKKEGFESQKTPSNLRFKEWLSNTWYSYSNLSLEDIKFSEQAMMINLHASLHQEKGVIDYFLSKYGYEGIGTPLEQLSCTTSDMADGVKGGIFFSATPPDKLSLPRSITAFREDPEFVSSVKKKWKEPQNSRIISGDFSDPFSFFAKIDEEVRVLLDPRGFFRKQGRDVAEGWLARNRKLGGVFYFSESRSTDVDRNDKICLLLPDGREFSLEGSNILAGLKEHNLDFDTLNAGFYFPPKQTESANVVLKEMKGLKAYLFLDEGLTLSHAVQTITRCRGVMEDTQTIHATVIDQKLCDKIFGNSAPSIETLQEFLQATQNEQEKKKIILNGYEEIYHCIAKLARIELKLAHANDKTPTRDEVIAAYEKRMAGFVEKSAQTAYLAFKEHEVPEDTRPALVAHAETTYARFAYENPYENETELKKEIAAISADVETKIKKIPTTPQRVTSKQVHHHLHSKSNIHRQQKKARPRPVDPIALEGEYGYDTKISSPKFVHSKMTPVAELLNCPFLSKHLYFELNHKKTAKLEGGSNEKLQVLKPIHYFVLLVRYDKQCECLYTQAIVISHEILSSLSDDLASCPQTVKGLEHQAALFTATGDLVLNGGGALKADLSGIVLDDVLQDLCILNGKIPDPEKLIRRIKRAEGGWQSFETLWNEVKGRLLNGVDKAQEKAFEALKERFLRENPSNSI